MTSTLERVRHFWSDHVNNEYYTRFDRGSPEYFLEIEHRRYKYHYHLPELFERITTQRPAGKRLLEIGCGIGIDTLQLAQLGFSEVVGVDLTETAVEIASRRVAREGLENVRFEIGNAEALSFPDATFDMVYSFGVLHHTPDIQRAVDEIYRVLRPSGTAHVMLYHSRSLVELVHRLLRIPYESPQNLRDHCPVVLRFTKDEARELFSAFTEVHLQSDYPFTYGMRFVTRLVPITVQRHLGRILGWHLMITATK